MKQSLKYADLQTLNCGRPELDPTHSIDDYAKDGGPEEFRLLCSFYHDPLHSLIVKEVQ